MKALSVVRRNSTTDFPPSLIFVLNPSNIFLDFHYLQDSHNIHYVDEAKNLLFMFSRFFASLWMTKNCQLFA